MAVTSRPWLAVAAALGACSGATTTPPARPAGPTIAVVGDECVDHKAAVARLRATLVRRGAAGGDLRVTIRAVPVAGDPEVELGTDVELVVERSDGTRGLERSYRLEPADCASAPELLALALDRFLSAFPIWAVPAPRRERAGSLAITGAGGLGAAVGPTTPSLDVTGAADLAIAPRHRVGLGVTVRASAPLALGSGSFQQTTGVLGGRWRYTGFGPWEPRVELRGGGVLVLGVGFDADNDRQILPWLEAVAGVSRRWRGLWLGAWIAVAPVSHRAVTNDGLRSRDLPNVHAGLSVEWALYEKK